MMPFRTIGTIHFIFLVVTFVQGFTSPKNNHEPIRFPTRGVNPLSQEPSSVVSRSSTSSTTISSSISTPNSALVQSRLCMSAVPKSKTNTLLETREPRIAVRPNRNHPKSVQHANKYNGNHASSSSSSSSWNSFKDGIYDFIDFLQGGTDALFLGASSSSMSSLSSSSLEKTATSLVGKSKSGVTAPRSSSSSSTMAVTYRDTVEKTLINTKSKGITTPTRKNVLVEQYNASLKTKTSSHDDNNRDTAAAAAENRFPSKFRQSFDSAKDIIYGTIDSLTSHKGKKDRGNNNDDDDSSSSSSSHLTNDIHAPYKKSLNQEKTVALVTEYAPDLSSLNPLRKIKANVVLSSVSSVASDGEKSVSPAQSVSNVVWNMMDSFQSFYETVRNIPVKLEQSVEQTQDTIGRTVEEIQRTPEKVQQKVEDTRKTLQETQKMAVQFVNDVQQVPKKVGDTVVETVREVQALPQKVSGSIEETKRSMEATREGVESLVKETKYWTGLEKRPTPPKMPPPLPTVPPKSSGVKAKEVALKVTKGTVVFAGKATVALVKGTVGMVTSGVKLAWKAASSRRKREKSVVLANTKKEGLSVDMARMSDAPKTIGEIDPLLEKEVTEALRLAEEAVSKQKVLEKMQATNEAYVEKTIQPSDGPNTTSKENNNIIRGAEGPSDIDINEAVERAKVAAEQAKKNAAELEEILNKRKTVNKV